MKNVSKKSIVLKYENYSTIVTITEEKHKKKNTLNSSVNCLIPLWYLFN